MEQVRGAILTGEFPPGGRVPPVRDLAAQAQVNPNTMQRALLELEREGLVISRGTMGRFVTQNPEILQTMRQAAQDAVIRECAAQLKAAGITIVQAAQMLLALNEEEENHG
jgi:DNA-binding transcriptional regulator YhcF (GntR family)